MSYLAIGSVTRSIAELLEKKMNKPPLLGAIVPRVTTLPLDDDRVDDADGVNLFLYRVLENPFLSNMGWSGDRSTPAGSRRPPLALTLSYLLTAYARPANGTLREDITAHQLLGNAMAVLHDYQTLNDIHDSDFDADLDTQFPKELRDSFEKVKISLAPHTMEEFSKIWTGLNKSYRLSVGYEVSLVQIAPLVPTALAGPPTQQISLDVGVLGAPEIGFLDPVSGPAGAQLEINGSGFVARGGDTIVRIGDFEIGSSELISLSPNKVAIKVPETVTGGPFVPVTVVAAGRESLPLSYEVKPWLGMIFPLRGFTGVPLSIPFEVPVGSTASAEIDGQAVAVTVDSPNKRLAAVVPAGIASNGPKSVVLIVDDGAPARSNARMYELLPMISKVDVTNVAAPAKTTIKLTGQRLNGRVVTVQYGKLAINGGENLDAANLTVEIPRILPASQVVSVIIDGRESNPLPPALDHIDPPEGAVGDEVTLSGKGLSGQTVSVNFAGINVLIGPQSFPGRFSMKIPAGVAAGAGQVVVKVNGNDTNAVGFNVVA